MNRDLTVGKPESVLWRFCLPLFGSVIFQQLYNIADSLVAGKFIGENALAAVGNSYEITLIFLAFAFGCNMGCSVVVSRMFGARKYEKVRTAVSTAFLMTAAVCVMLMSAGFICCRRLLVLLHTPDILMADSALYLDIYMLGIPFMFFYNVSTGIFSALGDSRTPFCFLAVSSIANILMDIWFVKAFRMGVAGVAWATLICQGISCALALFTVLRRLSGLPAGQEKAVFFSGSILVSILQVAVPSTLQQSFISVGNLVIQGVINGFGPGVIAGYAAGVKLNNLVITSITTLANGISNYTAQNIGAGKMERIQSGFKAGLKMVWMLCIPFCVMYFFFGNVFIRFFMDDPTDEALRTGIVFLRILSPFYFVVSAKLTADGVLRGASLMRAFMTATFTDLILRVVLAAVLSATPLGSTGIWLAWPVGWGVATILSVCFYFHHFGRKKTDTVSGT
ncbi:MAG: MATE family efflux transporter [Clostridia bacterium]|nr:MATE family efflux transporter [Clostridia bacterium]